MNKFAPISTKFQKFPKSTMNLFARTQKMENVFHNFMEDERRSSGYRDFDSLSHDDGESRAKLLEVSQQIKNVRNQAWTCQEFLDTLVEKNDKNEERNEQVEKQKELMTSMLQVFDTFEFDLIPKLGEFAKNKAHLSKFAEDVSEMEKENRELQSKVESYQIKLEEVDNNQ